MQTLLPKTGEKGVAVVVLSTLSHPPSFFLKTLK